ncbi:MAG: hypothetical protein ACJAYY_001138 [Paraglaciecola sp.]|jgi:hypothetical protein|uniref:T9SS type A sorting domain-containing protein n=1 Tax=Polaribacter sp. TaxID=1920175 RepID=UPI003AD3292D
MKQKNFFKITLLFFLSIASLKAQSAGDIAFVGFNTDGDKDFAIVALVDIAASTTIYFTDDETTGVGSPSALSGGEGTITWSTGATVIKAGTIVVFTDVDNDGNAAFGASTGTITRSGSFNLSGSKDGIIAFIGSDSSTPTTYIAAIQIGNNASELGPFDGDAITLTNTGLVIGTAIIIANNSASPDGANYDIGSRASEASYAAYYTLINTNVNWTNQISNGELSLEFSQESFTTNTTVWVGSTDTDWSDASNWSNGVPTIDSNVSIPSSGNNPEVKSGTTALAGNITINADASLEVTQELTSKGLTTINSSSSNSGTFKVTGNYTGSLVYNRTLATTNWYLISSPVSGETIQDIIANHTLATNALNYGLAPYDNSEALAYDSWDYQVAASTGALTNGKGYSVKLDAIGDISFIGTLNATDVSIVLTQGAIGGGTNFNLLGNPFTTFINSGTFLTEEGITTSDITSATLWVWNQSLGDDGAYETKVAGDSFKVAPGQGFFVEANSTNNVTFTEATQSHEATDTFQRSSKTEVHLFINDGNDSKFLKVYYINGTTKGFDNGYDGELFRGVSHSLALYSQLVSDSQGKNYQVQSLPNSGYENMVIPVGVKAAAGKEITFTADALNLPSGLKVFLEDRLTNTFTRLDEVNSTYKVTLSEASNGIGRFYVHTKSSTVLSTDNVNLENVSIYKTDNSNLRIAGLIAKGTSNLKVFSMLGKQVINISFTSNGIQDISLPNLASGSYIVQLATENGKLNKKITLE